MKYVPCWALLLPVLFVPACGTQQKAADAALSEVQAVYALIQEEATEVAPDQAQSIEESIVTAKGNLEKGDSRATLAAVKDLRPRVKELMDRLPAMRLELESTWADLNRSLPKTLTSLHRELNRARRPSVGARQEALDAARSELTALSAEWGQAQSAKQSGRLADAVIKAEQVKQRAVGLATYGHDGS